MMLPFGISDAGAGFKIFRHLDAIPTLASIVLSKSNIPQYLIGREPYIIWRCLRSKYSITLNCVLRNVARTFQVAVKPFQSQLFARPR